MKRVNHRCFRTHMKMIAEKEKTWLCTVKTVAFFAAAEPLSQEGSEPSDAKTSDDLSSVPLSGVYALVPAGGQHQDSLCRSQHVAQRGKKDKRIQPQSAFLYVQLDNDGTVHSKYWERADNNCPYDRKTNGYVLKEQCDDSNSVSRATDGFMIVGKSFECAIPFSDLERANSVILHNATEIEEKEKMKEHTDINVDSLIESSMVRVAIPPYFCRKALTRGVNDHLHEEL